VQVVNADLSEKGKNDPQDDSDKKGEIGRESWYDVFRGLYTRLSHRSHKLHRNG
jgi:hypothetical protein